MKRRWHSNQRSRISGVDLLIEDGTKVPGDLRLMVRGSDGMWRAVDMALAFYLVDFFTENEDNIRLHRGHWRQNGQRYFLSKCIQAIRLGWRNVADEIERQRA